MYAFIKGVLVEATPTLAMIETHGVGYRVVISANAFSQLPQIGEILCLPTSFIIREFSQTLYGFASPKERDLFEALLNINGIGPKLALSVIGHISLRDLHSAIAENDARMITKVPGIGKKTAERLMIEMRDKLPPLDPINPQDFAVNVTVDPRSQVVKDAMSALINLGYHQHAAQKAIKKTMDDCSEEIDLPSLITLALKNV